jgi:hypothetical protein
MAPGDLFDPTRLFGCRVVDGSGRVLGRVSALVHRVDGCDVLVERRQWLRHRAQRVDLDDLVESGAGTYRYISTRRRATGPSDDRVA